MRNRWSLQILTSGVVLFQARLLGFAFLALLAMGSIKSSTAGQPSFRFASSDSAAIANERYRELYDVIFPRGKPKGFILFRMLLRYAAYRGPDIQHEITKYEDGRVLVTSMECRAGISSYLKLREPIETMSRAQFERVKESAKSIPVIRKEFALSADRLRELTDAYNALSFPRLAESNSIRFHATGYKLSVQTDAEEFSYSVGAEDLGSETIALPIVKWMNFAHRILSQETATRTAKNP